MVDYVPEKEDDFIAKITRFEEATDIVVDGVARVRIYDMVADGVRYEFKNWKDFYPSTVRTQFITDLANDGFENLDK